MCRKFPDPIHFHFLITLRFLKNPVTHHYVIRTIFQAAHQNLGRGKGSCELPPSSWISTLKSSICHTAQPLGCSEGESIARACKDVRSAKKYVSRRGRGKGSDGFIYCRRSVIWIFTIANPAAIHSRDDVTAWVWHAVSHAGIHTCSRSLTPHISIEHTSQVGRDDHLQKWYGYCFVNTLKREREREQLFNGNLRDNNIP